MPKISKIKKPKKKDTKAEWIGDASRKLFTKLYNKNHNNMLLKQIDYLNKISDRRFEPSYDILTNSESQVSFDVKIYVEKDKNSKLYQVLKLMVFRLNPSFWGSEVKKMIKDDAGSITINYRNKDANGKFIKIRQEFSGLDDFDEVQSKYSIGEKNRAFDDFTNYLDTFGDI
jgi:hypothetical protein